ncbi:hypothetical protein AB6806_23925 [Bosea sp. RCC_152_1]|uniref:hypothetical protein n=1 Tax=Bosea sp. RCC_152_1 TaxID=3239228 RepID=UPI003525178D
MARFNPFARVKGSYGAPMGRHGNTPQDFADHTGKLYARHCGGDGYYDRGGAYWGHSRVCAVWTRGGTLCCYVEAYSPETAIAYVRTASRIEAPYP